MAATDVPPIRPGAADTLSISESGIGTNRTVQPAWIRLTEVLVRAVRYHFKLASRIEFADLVDRIWTGQPHDPIVITSLAEWIPDQSSQRPAVLVDRLDQDKDLQNRGIGDQLMGFTPGYFAHFKNGGHVLHCLGGREGEAETLACEVERCLTRFAPLIREAACLMKFFPYRTGKRVRLSEEHKDHYTVPVLCTYGYQEAWKLTPLDEAEITAIRTFLTVNVETP